MINTKTLNEESLPVTRQFSFEPFFPDVPNALFTDLRGRLYLASLLDGGDAELADVQGGGRIQVCDLTTAHVGDVLEECTIEAALLWFADTVPYAAGSTGDLRMLCRLVAEKIASIEPKP